MIPPAVMGAKFLPMFLARQRIFTNEEGLEGGPGDCPAISAPRPAKPNDVPSTPSSVFSNHQKIKSIFHRARISESAMASRVLRQTRISIVSIFIRHILTRLPGVSRSSYAEEYGGEHRVPFLDKNGRQCEIF
jgi:hypothetical protein